MTISTEAYWQQRDSKYRGEWTEEIQKNGTKTIAAVNKLLALAAVDGIERSEVSSGWRPKSLNEITPNAAKVSNHLVALACDLRDVDRGLQLWCLNNKDKLDKCGIWMEHPDWCAKLSRTLEQWMYWCHFQIVPPKSGKRIYIPNSDKPYAPVLLDQKPLPVRVRI